ncbi:hypothetical protein AWZ03_009528 [Drosophila navojoa]|uniref:HAUS augmin-like complex subunit 3 N-terminal domain-containing protein n=1 Tax=Drosophila navojoa TaxID=7232 RepID=A0A484B5W6_DRONA|nr:augmin complex subunit dgt3 [Drosophila navojoa]TDG44039.1 hypothetical protein AWZ03_009528 [Drosophila navojoa]
MGDMLNNSEMLKKLGIDSSNQWIIYDEQFEKFFNFLSENITDSNILTEQELLESEEMKLRGAWLKESERVLRLQQIESENPGLLKYTAHDVDALAREVEAIKEATKDYCILIDEMQNTKHSQSSKLSELECSILSLSNGERELLGECQAKARQLEEVQRENSKLSEDANKGFTLPQAPPLFMHQMPLEQYFLKCDSFMQYFTLYMKENFKIQEFTEFEDAEVNMQHFNSNLENLQKSIQYHTLEYIKEKAKAKATQALIDHVDLNKIHCISLADMLRETHELQLLNRNHLTSTYDTLMNALAMHVQQHTQQRIELVLYENTKLKLERALRRRENDKQLTTVISDALSNAELIWIGIQLDLEKKRNCTDSSIGLCMQAQSSCQRIQAMRSLNACSKGIYAEFVHEIASQLSRHLGQNVRSAEAKSCLFEYEKFGRLLTNSLYSMLTHKSEGFAHKQLAELKDLEQLLCPFVYNSPLDQPMLENVRYLYPMFEVRQQQLRFEDSLRQLRTQFQETILERMDKEKLWRYSKLLWIWFLTDPQRMIHAIDEVKKSSAKIPALTTAMLRPIGGLQRK